MPTTFQKCGPDVSALASEILCEFSTHAPVLSARVKIDYVFAFAEASEDGSIQKPALSLGGYRALGICRVLSLKDRAMGRGDAEISLDGDWWANASSAERKALLDHELHHIEVQSNRAGVVITDDLNRPKLKMRKHDYDFGWFEIIAKRHGLASLECQQAKKMLEQSPVLFQGELALA